MLTDVIKNMNVSPLGFAGLLCAAFIGWYIFIFLVGFLIKWSGVAWVMEVPRTKCWRLNVQMNAITALVQTVLFLLLGVILHSFIYKGDMPELGDIQELLRHCVGATILLTVGTLIDGFFLRGAFKKVYDEEVEHVNIFWPFLWANAAVITIVYLVRQILFGVAF